MRIRPYILAGGRSSRMGRDKAMLTLGGRTLLGRAVDTLRSVPALKDGAGKVTVTVAGERTELEGADRSIVDRYPGCGPLGGIEASLRDLKENGSAEFALFLPVDMPFLPAGLIDALVQEWSGAAGDGATVCCPVVDGRPQPLVSLVHKSVHPFAAAAITAGQLKVTPVWQSATQVLASSSIAGIGYGQSRFHRTPVSLDVNVAAIAGWNVPIADERLNRLWFSNLNDEEEFREAETFFSCMGSS